MSKAEKSFRDVITEHANDEWHLEVRLSKDERIRGKVVEVGTDYVILHRDGYLWKEVIPFSSISHFLPINLAEEKENNAGASVVIGPSREASRITEGW